MRYVLALDQGTTSSRAIVFNEQGAPVAGAAREYPQYYPQPGWVEHDAEEIWASQLAVAREALQRANLGAGDVAAIGVTNQRETSVVWDRATGQPLARAIVWQCRRTAERCAELRAAGLSDEVRRRTGLVLDPYFSATKLEWFLTHVPGLRARAERGEVAFGTIDSFLLWRLSGGRLHLTDVSNAARTMLLNIGSLQWDDELLRLFDVPSAMLPQVRSSSEVYGTTDPALFGAAIPLAGIAGDQQAATFGQACYQPGMAKNTYGTGCFLLMNTGTQPRPSAHGLLTTVAWQVGGRVTYALEGSVFIAGAAVQWLRDGLGIIASAAESEALAASVADSNGVYVVPAFVGLGAPYWDPAARGIITGLTQGVTRGHIARATLEALCYQTRDVVECMAQDAAQPLAELRVDGGAAANDLLMGMQADVLGAPVQRAAVRETTALGAAYLAGLATGVWRDTAALAALWRSDRSFSPHLDAMARETRYAGWRRAVAQARHQG